MSERTRLDEIVEQELAPYPSGGPFLPHNVAALATRAVKRAFRHGVEQAIPAAACKWWGQDTAKIRPAPVAEKACPACGHAPHGDTQCPRCASRSVLPYCPDRRKGQRRQGAEIVSDEGLFNIGRRYIESCGGVRSARGGEGMNRRSGKDRRKQTAEDFYCGNQWGLLLREPVAWYKPPPPLPRFEHTGRFETHVKKGEWYANEAGNPLYCNFDFETTGLWILRRLDP